MIFKMDTGAEVTVIPASSYNPVKDGSLHLSTRTLYEPGQQKLKVTRLFTGSLKKGDIAEYVHCSGTQTTSFRMPCNCSIEPSHED